MKRDKVTFWIVTGMSGAGKSHAINCFEDFGYYCVDNLPVALLPRMAELCARSDRPLQKVALGIDIRERGFLRVSRAMCWAVESNVMKAVSVGFEAEAESPCEYATGSGISV